MHSIDQHMKDEGLRYYFDALYGINKQEVSKLFMGIKFNLINYLKHIIVNMILDLKIICNNLPKTTMGFFKEIL